MMPSSLKVEKGDFYSLIQKDLKDLKIKLDEASVKNHSKTQWKAFVKSVLKEGAFQHLKLEYSKLENTKDIKLEEFKTSEYLSDNRSTSLSRIISAYDPKQFEIAKKVKVRIEKRKKLIDKYEAGHTQTGLLDPRQL